MNIKGSLIYEDYKDLYKQKHIVSNNFLIKQIQPSSVDLTLSEEGYEIDASFLSSKSNVRDALKKTNHQKILLDKGIVLKKK